MPLLGAPRPVESAFRRWHGAVAGHVPLRGEVQLLVPPMAARRPRQA
jgi:hypothetical protein